MWREIAQVVWGLNLEVVPIDPQKPAERSDREHRKNIRPCPEMPATGWRRRAIGVLHTAPGALRFRQWPRRLTGVTTQ